MCENINFNILVQKWMEYIKFMIRERLALKYPDHRVRVNQ